MKKRFVTLLLATSMVLSLFGCKTNKNKTNNGETASANASSSEVKFASYDYIYEIMGRKDSVSGSTLYKYADFITLGEYKGLEAEVDSSLKVVSDEDFDSALNNILSKYAEENKITTGVTKDGDTINLDYSGLLDGVAFDNGTATDASYTIGGTFIEDLDRGLIGLEVGKEYSIPCTFPSDYSNNPDLAGKDVVFVVTVNYISEKVTPELTDELAKTIATDNGIEDKFSDVAGLKSYLREQLESQALQTFKDNKFESVWKKVLEASTFTGMPQVDYDATYSQLYSNAQNQFAQYSAYGFDWKTFLSMYGYSSEDDFVAGCKEKAEDYVKTKLAILAIADKENITASEEEYKECAQQYVTAYEFNDLDDLYTQVGDSKEAFIEERYYEVIYKKVYDLLLESSKEVETPSESKDADTNSQSNEQ